MRQGNSWPQQVYLKASNAEGAFPPFVGDGFGWAVAVSGEIVAVGARFESSGATGIDGEQSSNSANFAGAAYVFGPPTSGPEIRVEQSGTNIVDGGSTGQFVVVGTNTLSRSFVIRNIGNEDLTGLNTTLNGPDAARFSVTSSPSAPLAPSNSTTFIVRFAPASTGTNTATLHIASNDEDENPFDISLSGLSLSFTEDRDGDGLNDASELLMASMGFNFQINQASLVNTLFNNAKGAGLFTQSQLQGLGISSSLLALNPSNGFFTLTIGVEKATFLTNFVPFPMTAPQTTINAEGKLEFQFSSPDGAAFYRVEAR